MNKKIFGRKLSRSRGAKLALFRSLTKALCLYGQIKTTKAKAKAFTPFFEKQIKIARKGGISSQREVLKNLGNDRLSLGVITEIVSKGEKTNGKLNLTPLPARRGDNAEMVRLEMVGWTKKEEKPVKKVEKEETKKVEVKKVTRSKDSKTKKPIKK
jgi:large subunit ribosomal protein L17